jgi:hypothetical protein
MHLLHPRVVKSSWIRTFSCEVELGYRAFVLEVKVRILINAGYYALDVEIGAVCM